MSGPATISSLFRALRPATRLSTVPRVPVRSPYLHRTPLWQPKGLRAPFTTSPTAIPPQPEASADTPTTPSSSEEGSQYTQSSPPSPQPPRFHNHRLSEKARREPTFLIQFTCKACTHRSMHEMSKQGYYNGTVLITCPGCKNRHVISDHLQVRCPILEIAGSSSICRQDWTEHCMTFLTAVDGRFLKIRLSQSRI